MRVDVLALPVVGALRRGFVTAHLRRLSKQYLPEKLAHVVDYRIVVSSKNARRLVPDAESILNYLGIDDSNIS
jgi:hypothetical protein